MRLVVSPALLGDLYCFIKYNNILKDDHYIDVKIQKIYTIVLEKERVKQILKNMQ